ncbi:retropepsin-like aspartic protease [Parafilimonas sp.]|uniref:retropepsin-like aspartic protease n=1 Tax=Parafilimonas sp. TaxID=1969739 RepID=UPI0039E54F28
MVIRLPLRFEGSKGEQNLYALFDSGATYSCINEEIAEGLEVFTTLHTPMRMATATATTIMEIKNRVTLDFYHYDTRLTDEFYVIPDLSEQVIIGASTMQKWRIKLDFENDTIILDPTVAKAILINLIKH